MTWPQIAMACAAVALLVVGIIRPPRQPSDTDDGLDRGPYD